MLRDITDNHVAIACEVPSTIASLLLFTTSQRESVKTKRKAARDADDSFRSG